MEKIKNTQPFFEEPKLEVVHLTETDIILTSGEPLTETPQEGEFIPA